MNRSEIEEIINIIYPHQIIECSGDSKPNKVRIYGKDGIDYIDNIKKNDKGYTYTVHRFKDNNVFKEWLLNKDKLYRKIKKA